MTDDMEARKGWMGLLAKVEAEDLATRMVVLEGVLGGLPAAHELRAAEIGGVMVRGRIGGTGRPFNLGEMTVTRCSLRLAGGEVGHGYVQGRDKAKARNAALVDALMQTDRAAVVRTTVLAPLAEGQAARVTERAARAAATKVEFFTMVRGEDQ